MHLCLFISITADNTKYTILQQCYQFCLCTTFIVVVLCILKVHVYQKQQKVYEWDNQCFSLHYQELSYISLDKKTNKKNKSSTRSNCTLATKNILDIFIWIT